MKKLFVIIEHASINEAKIRLERFINGHFTENNVFVLNTEENQIHTAKNSLEYTLAGLNYSIFENLKTFSYENKTQTQRNFTKANK